ncbi:MAG: TonB-dependent receptor [Sphingobacteriales bacterium]|nr:TonB-dependent receptor [Sphingobacteriales bacterium]
MRRFCLTAIASVLLLSGIYAQFPGGGQGRAGGGNMNIGRFYGKIIDAKTNRPVDAASVTLVQSKFDSVTRKRKDIIIGGQLTKANGDFSIENLPIAGNYKLKVTAIGYVAFEEKVAFEVKMPQGGSQGGDFSQMVGGFDKDLGNIKLQIDSKVLDEVVVQGTAPTLKLAIDRKVFNVEKNIVSAGGTATDVLRNVPTVSVDVDGNVSLRNNAPQIFVDGRPTTLTIDQIPADAIQSVELITNPSAKFDASGGQSGIINFILKKNRKAGYNGSVRAGIDMRGKINSGADINIRQGKINVFANANYNQRKSKSRGETDRNEFGTNPASESLQVNNNTGNGAFAFGRFGIDYFIDNRNTVTIGQNIVGGNFDFADRNTFLIDSFKTTPVFESQYRNTDGKNKFRNYGSQLSYKHLFTKAGKELTADVNFNRSHSNNGSRIYSRSYFDEGQTNPKTGEFLQRIDGGGNNTFLTSQLDFTNPVTDKMKWEMGVRSQIRTFESEQLNYYTPAGGNEVYIPNISNKYKYKDYVFAGYVTYSQQTKKNLSFQLGLRAESSKYDGEQQLTKQTYSNSFPLSLFPSIFLTQSFKNKSDLQLNFTRRINRPNFFQLMPNTDYSDPFNYQTGNPNLKPEFTYSLESSYQKTFGKRNSTFLATLFGKYTTDLISRYQRRDKLGQSSDTAFITTYINATSAYAGGLELVLRSPVTKWWEINYNVNIYYSKINGSDVVAGLENERTSWFAKINNTFKVSKGWSIQLSGDYNARSILPVSTSNSGGGGGGGRFGGGGGGMFGGGQQSTTQGYIDANYFADLGVRKEIPIKKNTLTISANWSDIFRTRKNVVHTESPYIIQESWRRRDPQFFRLNISYRFGKFDISLFKRKNMKGEAGALQEGMGGIQQ